MVYAIHSAFLKLLRPLPLIPSLLSLAHSPFILCCAVLCCVLFCAAVYATVAPPAPTLAADLAPAAVAALLAAAREAKTPQGISISGIPGLTLEDKILLARLLGHVSSEDRSKAANYRLYHSALGGYVSKHAETFPQCQYGIQLVLQCRW